MRSVETPATTVRDAAAEPSSSATSGGPPQEWTQEMTTASTTISRPVPHHDEPAPGWWTRLVRRAESKISRLSSKNNFWHRLCSWIWLPLAFRSGIKFAGAHTDNEKGFSVMLPFRRFNRNWYNAMAGAALLANSEVAGGMYVFQKCGGDYTVVCKELTYKFMRPCVGPALYRVTPLEDIEQKVKDGGEFNITVDMNIVQMVTAGGEQKERRVGTSTATFHVTPKDMARRRQQRWIEKQRQKAATSKG